VRSVWIIDAGSFTPRLVTAYGCPCARRWKAKPAPSSA